MRSEKTGTVRIVLKTGTVKERWDVRRHALGQGGIDDIPLSEPVIERLRNLKPRLIRLFVQEYYRMYPRRFGTLERAVDAILATGAKPLLSLCMRPKALYPDADQDHTEPRDWKKWETFVGDLVRYFRRKKKAIAYWEVFNEPDIGEQGGCPGRFTPGAYVKYYRHTVEAIRRADDRARVGGPAVADFRSPLLPVLLYRADRDKLPLDFVSYHLYSNDPGLFEYSVRYVKNLLKLHPGLSCEVILDEWNNTGQVDHASDPYEQAALTGAVVEAMQNAGLDWSCHYHIMDMGVHPRKWQGWFSPEGLAKMGAIWNAPGKSLHLMRPDGSVRAPFTTFRLLYRLGRERIEVVHPKEGPGGLASRSGRGIHALLWNYHPQGASKKKVRLELEGWRHGTMHVKVFLLSKDHPEIAATGLPNMLLEKTVVERGRLMLDMPSNALMWLELEAR